MRLAVAIALAPFAVALALHVQIGVSARSRHTGEWVSSAVEIGGGGSTDATVPQYESHLLLGFSPFALRFDGSHAGQVGIDVAVTQTAGGWARWTDPEEAIVYADGIGYDRTYFSQPRRSHQYAVVTMRGDPYSSVVNDTGRGITVNGAVIPDGGSSRLALPLFLVMPQISGVKFFDLDTGDEITPVAVNGSSYYNGAYCLNWTGDIIVSCHRPPHTVTNGEAVIYGDMKSENADAILHAENGSPLYGPAIVPTNITMMTWWDFTQEEWGSPLAKINGETVCAGHSTTHIIPHEVNSGRVFERDGKYTFTFTMSLVPESGKSGGGCSFRCWDAAAGDTAADYGNCPAAHKASVYGYAGTVATFKVTITRSTGEWKVESVE